jgi:phosphatidylglycerol---prolipoprotein diacylglyceryl transferase
LHPILLKIGSLTIFTYGFFLALAFLAAMALAGREARRVGLPPGRVYDLCFYSIIAALIGARFLQVLLEWDFYRVHPQDIVKVWDGGLAFQGGLVLGILTAVFYMWRHSLPVWKTLDVLALAMPLGQSIGRIGCFMAGCCYGRPNDLSWGVTFTDPQSLGPVGVKIHPTQLFMAVLLITMARGLKIDCGCGLFFQRPVGWAAVLEDVILFGATAWVCWREGLTGQEKGGILYRSAQV